MMGARALSLPLPSRHFPGAVARAATLGDESLTHAEDDWTSDACSLAHAFANGRDFTREIVETLSWALSDLKSSTQRAAPRRHVRHETD